MIVVTMADDGQIQPPHPQAMQRGDHRTLAGIIAVRHPRRLNQTFRRIGRSNVDA